MKLRLPNKLIAAIVAAASPVLFSTLSTATLGAAAVATLGQQASGDNVRIESSTKTIGNYTAEDTLTYNLSGVSGNAYLNNGGGFTTLANIVVENMSLNNGNTGAIYCFQGNISGSGPIEFRSGRTPARMTLKFDGTQGGSMSGYSGNLATYNSDNMKLEFVSTTVGSEEAAGTITTSAGTTYFTATDIYSTVVTSPNISIGAGTTTFHGSRVAATGTITQTDGSTLVLANTSAHRGELTAGSITGGSVVNHGTMTISGALNINSLTLESGSETTLNGGGSLGTIVGKGGSLTLGRDSNWMLAGALSLGEGSLTVGSDLVLRMNTPAFEQTVVGKYSFSEDDGLGQSDGYVTGDFQLATAKQIELGGQPLRGAFRVEDREEGGQALILSLDGSDGGQYLVNWNVDYAVTPTEGKHNAYGATEIYLTTPQNAQTFQRSTLNIKSNLQDGTSIVSNGGLINLEDGVTLNHSALSFVGVGTATLNSNGSTGALGISGTFDGEDTLFSKLDGDANVSLTGTAETVLKNTFASSLTGVLMVNNTNTNSSSYDGADLVIGTDCGQNVDISSFSRIEMADGSRIRYQAVGNKTLNNITLKGNATFHMFDTNGVGNHVTFGGKTNIGEHTFTLLSTWKNTIDVQNLVGSGTFAVTAPSSEAGYLNIQSLSGFEGNLSFTKAGSALTATVATGDSDVKMRSFTMSGSANGALTVNLVGTQELTVTELNVGAGTLNIGNGTLAGNVTVDGTMSGAVNVLTGSTLTLGSNFSADSAEVQGAGFVNVAAKDTDTKALSLGTDGYLTATVDLSAYKGKVVFNNSLWKIDGVAVNGATWNSTEYTLTSQGGDMFQVNTTISAETLAEHTSSAAKLVGSGTFVITSTLNNINTAQALPENVSLDAQGWHGVVRVIGGKSNIGSSIQALTQGDSWVELQGVSGSLGGNNTYSGNIILTNNGDTAAMAITNSESIKTTTLSGKIAGDGDIIRTIGNGNSLKFAGDISQWTGTYYNSNQTGTFDSGYSNVYFRSGETINANFINKAFSGGCYLTLHVYGDTTINGILDAAAATGKTTQALNVTQENAGVLTINNTANINTLTAGGKTVILGSKTHEDGTVTYGNLTLKATSSVGNLIINAGATVNSNAHNSGTSFIGGGDIDINAGGTLNLTGADVLGWGNNGVHSINMEGTEAQHALMTVAGKQTFSSTLHLNGYTDVKNANNAVANSGLELFKSDERLGCIVASGVQNIISTNVFLRDTSTITTQGGAELTISGTIGLHDSGGTGSVSKAGAGTLTLSGTNTFAGNLTVSGGTLKVNNVKALGAYNTDGTTSRSITIGTNAILDVNGKGGGNAVNSDYAVILAGGTITNSGADVSHGTHQLITKLTIQDADSYVKVIGADDHRFGLIGSGYAATSLTLDGHDLIKTGTGTFMLNRTAVSGSGKLVVREGTIQFRTNNTHGTIASDIVMDGGNITGEGADAIYLNGDISVTAQKTGTFSAKVNTDVHTLTVGGTANMTMSGSISGTGSVKKIGTDVITLSVANTYSGNTTITGGELNVTDKAAMGSGSLLTIQNGALRYNYSGSTTKTLSADSSNALLRAEGGTLILNADSQQSYETPVAFSGLFMSGGKLELSGGRYTVGKKETNNGLFADTDHTLGSALVLKDGAELTMDATSATWRFQVNSDTSVDGNGGGIYIKGKAAGENGAASVLTAKLHGDAGSGTVSFKAHDVNSATGAHIVGNTAGGKNFLLTQAEITIADADYSINGGSDDKMVNNRLSGSAIINSGSGTLTVNNAANTLVGVDAEGGAITVQNAANSAGTLKSIVANGGNVTIQGLGESATVNLTELTIAGSKTVSAYTGTPTSDEIAAAQNGSNAAVEATLAISNGTLTAGNGAKLNAHLSLGNNTTLNIADATTGTKNGLTMGSSVTIAQDAKINLSDNIINGLNSLTIGEGLTLFSGVDAFNINGAAYNADTTYHASDFFNLSNSDVAVTRPWDFVVKFGADNALRQSGSGQSIFLYMETPEPATATLSLLALAALAARRRRK